LCETHSRKRRLLYRNTSPDTTHTHTHARVCVTYFCSISCYLYIYNCSTCDIYIYMCVCVCVCACVSFVRVKEKSCSKGLYVFAGRQSVAQTSSAPPSRCQSQTRATMLSLQCRERPQCCFSIIVTYTYITCINGPRYRSEWIYIFFHEKTCLAPHIRVYSLPRSRPI